MTEPTRAPDLHAEAAPAPGQRSPLAPWWNGLSRTQRVVVAVLGFVVGLNVVLTGLGATVGGGNPGGPISSSYSTGSGGLEAFADLARASGHPVTRIDDNPAVGSLPVDSTLVVADPEGLGEDDYRAVGQFVVDGGRLVVAGPASSPVVQGLTGSGVRWTGREAVDRLVVDDRAEPLGSARSVAGDRGGRWSDAADFSVHLTDRSGQAVIISTTVGDGTLVAMADADLLHNEHLATADNAALALDLIGGTGRPVLFLESVHGFAVQGADAFPPSWKWAAAGLVLALLMGLWWAGSRYGPPEAEARALRPARSDHVRAVAADLERVATVPADLADPLLRANRRAFSEQLGIEPDATDAVWRSTATSAGVDPDMVGAGVAVPTSIEAALYVGALAAHREAAVAEPVEPLSPTVHPGTVAGPEAP